MSCIVCWFACCLVLVVFILTGNLGHASRAEDFRPTRYPVVRRTNKVDDLCIITRNGSKIFDVQYLAGAQPPKVSANPSRQSKRVSPPDYYKIVWEQDWGRNASSASLYRGNAIVLKTVNGIDFILKHEFRRTDIPGFRSLRVERSHGRLPGWQFNDKIVLRWKPPEVMDRTNGRVSEEEIDTWRNWHLVFRYGASSFEIDSRQATERSRDLVVDRDPDLPKRNCKALRYVAKKNWFGRINRYEFSETPVAVQQRQHLDSIRTATVENPKEPFTYLDIGMPIVCQDLVSYIIYENPRRFYAGTQVRAVSVHYLLWLADKWGRKSRFKSLEAFADQDLAKFLREPEPFALVLD